MIKQELIGRIPTNLKGEAYRSAVDKALSPESIANYQPKTQGLKNKSGK